MSNNKEKNPACETDGMFSSAAGKGFEMCRKRHIRLPRRNKTAIMEDERADVAAETKKC